MTPSDDRISQIAESAPERVVSEVKIDASSSGVAPAMKRMESREKSSLKLCESSPVEIELLVALSAPR